MSGRRGRSKSPGATTVSPMSGSSTPLVSGTTANPMQDFLDMLSKAKIKNDDDYKSIKIPQFSDGSDWDAVVFELEINLEQYWKHQNDLDIVDYLNGIQQHCDQKFIDKADKLIYHAIVTAAKRDSFARNQIMASRHADAVPRVERNQGFKLFCLFQDIFTNKSKSKANLPNALLTFNQMKMSAKESAKDYISRVDLAVSDLALLNEKVSVNSWLFILSNGLRPEFSVTRKGVLFMEKGFDSITEVKNKILQEETINSIGKPDSKKSQNESKDSEIAHAVFDGTCNHCGKKGHKKAECNKLKKEQKVAAATKATTKHWCDICYKVGHSTEWCFYNPVNKGKGKGKAKGQTKGKGKGKGGKGKPGKGGRGKGNFPASYVSDDAHYATETWKSTEENWELKEDESSSTDWFDYSFSVFETEFFQELNWEIETEELSSYWLECNTVFATEIFQEKESLTPYDSLFAFDTWTELDLNNATELDFRLCTWEAQPTFASAKGGPGCESLLSAMDYKPNKYQKKQLEEKRRHLRAQKENGEEGLWMYLDSGASRSVIQENSPIRSHLSNVKETSGSCSVGNGANLKYLERGTINSNNEVTVVKDLKYDLYAAVAAAKRGVTCVLDYNSKGENQSYLLCKTSGIITPLIERRKGILEVPVHLYVDKAESGLIARDKHLSLDLNQISMANISKFWYGMDKCSFDPKIRENNSDEISLFMFDIINSLGEKQKDFLIHARLAHLPRKAILQMIKDGAKGLPYNGKFKELCRPCLQARHRAENHGKKTTRHPDGKIGEHLHSDLAVVNLSDFNGFKYVLTVVDEISDEVVVALLKEKKAEVVLNACKKIHKLITARNKSQLKTWQFDRGSEFLNELFDDWISGDLGAQQMFSNIEHPWENGRAERSFSTIFQKARAMMLYADLPNGIWGKAVLHSVYLKNRCPSTRVNYLSPLQYRTGEVQDFSRLRVFGCPAQIFVRSKKRANNKLSSRSEHGTFIGMSRVGNGYIFRIKRTNNVVEIDSKDVKFNETFSDCMDKKGRSIKGGRVLEPDLINELDMAADVQRLMATWNAKQKKTSIKPSRFSASNPYDVLQADNDEFNDDNEGNDDNESNDNNEGNDDDEGNDDNKGNNDDEGNSSESDNDKEFSKPFEIKNFKTPIDGPIKTKQTNSGEMKRLLPSKGFRSEIKKTSASQSETRKSKREIKNRERFQPSFLLDEEDDLTNLDPNDKTFEQLLSCMEQNVKSESGKLNDPDEELLKSLQDIGRPDPKSQKAIDKLPEHVRKRYNDATTKEYEGMKSKDVMEFVRMTDIPKDAKIYICIVNWVTKYVLGVYQKTKCRICFGGHHYVKTFTDCFAPTVNFCSVLIMLCLSAMFGWYIGSLDYAQAYLNADIDEECFLRAPEFLREFDKDGVEFIWRLKKVIYGHPKGSRLWAECLHQKLQQLGYSQFATDQCVYGKWVNWNLQDLKRDSYFVFVLIHSDDLIIISNLKNKMMEEKAKFLQAFDGIDQGTLTSFCGVEVDISDERITLSMQYYWKKVMARFGIAPQDKADKPLKTKISKDDCPTTPNESRKQTYLQIIGSIIFGFTHCRLDLAFPVGMLTRVMHSPSETHLKQLMDLLKYINATMKWGLNFFRDHTVRYGMDFIFFGFCDSSHGDDPATFRSTGGYFFFLRMGQACISSKSGQTPDIALSSTEAETIWACCAATQGAFIKQFLDELKIFGSVSFELMEDSQPAINAQRKNVSQSRFRHIKIKWHYIRQLLSEGWCKMVKINTKDQIADMATKILTSDTVEYFSKIVLGSVAVDQSLHVHGNDTPYNDWGVVSEPYYHSS